MSCRREVRRELNGDDGDKNNNNNKRENERLSEDVLVFVEGEKALTYKCFASSSAIFIKSEKNACGSSGCLGPNLAMISQLYNAPPHRRHRHH